MNQDPGLCVRFQRLKKCVGIWGTFSSVGNMNHFDVVSGYWFMNFLVTQILHIDDMDCFTKQVNSLWLGDTIWWCSSGLKLELVPSLGAIRNLSLILGPLDTAGKVCKLHSVHCLQFYLIINLSQFQSEQNEIIIDGKKPEKWNDENKWVKNGYNGVFIKFIAYFDGSVQDWVSPVH